MISTGWAYKLRILRRPAYYLARHYDPAHVRSNQTPGRTGAKLQTHIYWGMSKLVLDLPNADAWPKHLEGLKGHGGLMVPLPSGLAAQLFDEVDVDIRLESKALTQASGRIVQVTPEGVAAVLFDGEPKETLLKLKVETAVAKTEAPAWAKYETLTKPQKLKLARQSTSADERRRVLRDHDPSLHGMLLSNPSVTANEIVAWFRSGLVPKAMIEQISKRSEFAGNAQIMEALIQDPRTPIPIALRLVGRISLDLCRRIAKQGRLRTQIVSAARKRVISP